MKDTKSGLTRSTPPGPYPRYVASGGRTWLVRRPGAPRELVANYVARITREITLASSGRKVFGVEGTTPAGQAFAFEIPAEDFEDWQTLGAAIEAALDGQLQVSGPSQGVRR